MPATRAAPSASRAAASDASAAAAVPNAFFLKRTAHDNHHGQFGRSVRCQVSR
jgi:hypothetical protein